ncbi:MAG: aminotransferase class IV [Bacteroidota bacterium]
MIGDAYIFNGRLLEIDDQPIKLNSKNSTVVYEVFTWENNSAVFFDEHYKRLLKSVELKKLNSKNIPCKEEFLNHTTKLANANRFVKNNIRLDLIFSEDKFNHYLLYFTKSIFPTELQYKNGVNVGLCFGERKIPNAKIANSKIRRIANEKIADNNLFEVLLVNSENIITEGSRSNIFFVKNNTIYTSKVKRVLNGVTRQKVIEIANKINIEVKETDIKLENISEYESAFLTSTAMIVLPISNIENIRLSVKNKIIEKLYSSFLGL